MVQTIESQIENINASLEWIRKNKPSDFEQRFLQLIEERRKLKKLDAASQDNPAIAAYGVSQVGKSYLMNCILQKDGKPFLIEADGTTYKFIEEMNPKTDNTEATGVVTRFTSFSKDKDKYSKEYPILMKCLSVADVLLVLCDGYFNDISDYTTYSESEIKEYAENIYNKYIQMPVIMNSAITADSVMDIRAYFHKHVNNAQAFLHTSFFDQLALVVERIPVADWVEVFSVLWHRSEYQTKLFKKMLGTLAKFNYAQYVYLPAQSMLHDGINENTVMSVQCLNELFLASPRFFTDAYLRSGDSYTKVANLTKSEVCAVCAEIIVKIDDEYLENTSRYSFININDLRVQEELSKGRDKKEVYNPVTGKNDVTYETSIGLLKENDMLDFPGARSRKKELLDTLNEDAILINVLLRGKVAYLFNMYNESMLINILLFCHHAAQNDVTDIPLLLNDWIMNYVGDTMEKRQKTLELTGGISPLFYIGTKFNMDMQKKTEDIENRINALNGRWQQRFEKVLYHQCFNADGSLDSQKVKIFLNWTRSGECFNNSYILRDFKFSGPLASKLYEDENTPNRTMTIPQEHYENLRETFIHNEAVKRFFSFPELSWDVCASVDNDGAQYIISQLAKVASCMGKTRDEQFKRLLQVSTSKIKSVMEGYFVSADLDELLQANIRKARAISREMAFTCNSDNYYFGHLLQALQLTETVCYREIHAVMQGPDINSKVNDFKDYEIIRNTCKKSGFSIEEAKTTDDKWQCLINTFGFISREEANEYLVKKKVDVNKLFDGTFKRKLNSCIIGDAIFDKWCSRIKSVDFLNEFSNEDSFDTSIMTMLVEDLIITANSLNLRDYMAEAIAEYVNVVNIHTANETLLADLLASIINDFILDFGFKYLSDEDINKAKAVCEKNNIPAFKYICKQMSEVHEEEELTEMFNEMFENPQALLPSFDDNYNKWIEYMFVSFVVHLDIPEYDHDANEALAIILEQINVA